MKTLVLLSAILLAHDWYPRECCHTERDCIQLPCGELGEGGTWQGKKPWRLDKSPDGKCHICVGASGRGNFYCAFLPDVTS